MSSPHDIVMAVFFGLVAVAYGIYLYWYNHPAVRLKRQIKQGIERENQAKQELDDAFEQAKADMDQVARDWKQS
jgi:hypothetical protein